MNEIIDFHCHLDLYENFEQIVQECERRKVYTLAVTTTPRAWKRNYELAQQTKYVRAALGLHPQLVTNDKSELGLWEEYFSSAKYIGEVGLDASPRYYPYFENQQRIFDRILSMCAQAGGKVLSIHSVRCASKVLDAINRSNVSVNNKIVLHWFTGSLIEARRAIELGCYFSVNIAMLQSENGRKLLSIIPKDQVLTETDGPFTRRNNDIQRPWDVVYCIDALSIHYDMKPKEIQSQIYRNLSILLK